MAEKLTHQEFDRQVEEAMEVQAPGQGAGGNFAPAIQKMRLTASKSKPLQQQKQLPIAR